MLTTSCFFKGRKIPIGAKCVLRTTHTHTHNMTEAVITRHRKTLIKIWIPLVYSRLWKGETESRAAKVGIQGRMREMVEADGPNKALVMVTAPSGEQSNPTSASVVWVSHTRRLGLSLHFLYASSIKCSLRVSAHIHRNYFDVSRVPTRQPLPLSSKTNVYLRWMLFVLPRTIIPRCNRQCLVSHDCGPQKGTHPVVGPPLISFDS